MKKIFVGADYYPEDWEEERIDWDVEKLNKSGFNIVRIAEFAWHNNEPEEGKYDFTWLHNVVDKMHAGGIKVILGTPTATPPHWLYKKYPDMATVNAAGVRASHGGRRHACSNNPHYIEYSAKMTEKLAQEFADDPAVIGWQIDNEIYPHEPGCFCEHCMKRFHDYLREKYGTVEKINKEWNLTLFSQWYDSIDDIPAPANGWHNPHIIQAWNESHAEAHMEFVNMQADIIHKYSKAAVGTDTMPYHGFDYREMEKKLDVVQFNHYNTVENEINPAMWMDFLRKYSKRPLWNTETEATWNGATCPGMALNKENFIYMNTWLPMMLGGEAVLFWLWRTHWAGHELMHGAVYDSCGREAYSLGEIEHAIRDFDKAEDFLTSTKVVSDSAIHLTSVNWNIQKSQVINSELQDNTLEVDGFYRGALKAGIHPDVIDLSENLDGYKVVYTPVSYTLEQDNFREKITKWVNDGGVWVAGPLTDIRNRCGAKYKDAPYGFLEELTGAYMKYPMGDDGGQLEITNNDGEKVKCAKSFELFNNENGESLLTVTGGHKVFIGLSAAMMYNVGKGKVILLGTFPEEKELARIMGMAADLAGATRYDITNDAFITRRVGDNTSGEIAASIVGTECSYRFSGVKKDILTGIVYKDYIKLSPFQVAVLEDIK